MAKLYFRHGTVGSAKTLNLLAVAHNYTSQGKKVLIAKPDMDVRFGANCVRSRAGLEKPADILIGSNTILRSDRFMDCDCVLVDEAQFLSAAHIDQLRIIADEARVPVICYGLRTDFRTNLFAGSKRLFELADSIEEIKTTCYECNKKAIINIKFLNGLPTLGGPQVEMGCEEKYLPCCFGHFYSKIKDLKTHENKSLFEVHPIEDADQTGDAHISGFVKDDLSGKMFGLKVAAAEKDKENQVPKVVAVRGGLEAEGRTPESKCTVEGLRDMTNLKLKIPF